MAPTSRSVDDRRTARHYVPLLHRVVWINVLLLVASVALTIIVLVPGQESSARLDEEGIVLLVTVGLAIVLNVLLLRRVVRPLQQLTALARTVDLSGPPELLPGAAPTSEAGELALTFNEMLARLQTERREATGRVLAAQEGERLRVARDLHDEVGQELTAVLLLLSRVQARAPETLRPAVLEAQEAIRTSLKDVRRIAIELRPEALDDLGLTSALAVLCERFVERTGIRIESHLPNGLPALPDEVELVIYRVAQEALTNVARHSGTDRARLSLVRSEDGIVLSVRDSGVGFGPAINEGSGIRGMRERAGLIGATLRVSDLAPDGGCEVRLEVPAEGAA
jgi:two-component system, NarL family, sensor histidine kinase UhpB